MPLIKMYAVLDARFSSNYTLTNEETCVTLKQLITYILQIRVCRMTLRFYKYKTTHILVSSGHKDSGRNVKHLTFRPRVCWASSFRRESPLNR